MFKVLAKKCTDDESYSGIAMDYYRMNLSVTNLGSLVNEVGRPLPKETFDSIILDVVERGYPSHLRRLEKIDSNELPEIPAEVYPAFDAGPE